MALSQDELKKMVGYKSVDDYVKSGMVIGLGTGSTAYYAVERVGEKLKSGELENILAIPTSIRTKEQAEELGIPLVTLDTHSKLDVAIDGADEVDPDLNLVKGGGGALLREKQVEVCADKFIVIGEKANLWSNCFSNYFLQLFYNLNVWLHFYARASFSNPQSMNPSSATDWDQGSPFQSKSPHSATNTLCA